MTDKQIEQRCAWKSFEGTFCPEAQQQLDQLKEELAISIQENEEGREINAELKAENEELKNFHINLVGVKECEIRELVKYKQTLAEIKEIANKFDYWNSNLSQASETLHEIIEKINEVEDE